MPRKKQDLTKHNVTRRVAIQATGVGLAAIACDQQLLLAESSDQDSFTDKGYRLYGLIENDPYIGVQDNNLPNPFSVFTGFSTQPTKNRPHTFVWATEKHIAKIQAIRFSKTFGLPPLRMKTPDDVPVFGTPEDAKQTLFFLLAPNANFEKHPKESTFESVNQVVVKWREDASQVNGLTIEPVKPSPSPTNGKPQSLVIPGQIRVRFEGEINEKALNEFLSHPPVRRAAWAKGRRRLPDCSLSHRISRPGCHWLH